MEAITSTASITLPREPASYDEVSMQQSLLFSDSLEVPSVSLIGFVSALVVLLKLEDLFGSLYFFLFFIFVY